MSIDVARAVADTVLYEGYVLYPYRASAQKNRSRWQFGVLMPPDFAAADPSETSGARAEVVAAVANAFTVRVALRFLQVQRRSVHAVRAGAIPVTEWDEAVEHELTYLLDRARPRHDVRIPGGVERETRYDNGAVVAEVVRERLPLSATLTLTAEDLPGTPRAVRLRARVDNHTDSGTPAGARTDALPAALVAAHLILAIEGGAFVSMVDPPQWAAEAVAGCGSSGLWPVLAGPPGRADVMLAAPIILYDHPEVAPESPADLYDATEIDEILLLRTRALTDAEKREARATDPRAAAVLDRADALDGPTLARLHGTLREAAPLAVTVDGRRVARGATVVLRPGTRRADAQDMFLVGRTALVEDVLFDVDDRPYLAVTLTDDPGADVMRGHGRFLYFAPDEVEPA
ncbi:hypothetical protein [Phytohabitans rumicis]|uniref:Uncharacterized protein n=1 Tax=Phytohabitans rumicis TaxID=1076125 RepID=A0A6V8LD13_9ACTN|nr:hypothetical protein [Phytohabitans rumicis]GFJ94214.1 hypothetical protein Prum_078560 [Phytohabitans rumicis]